MSTRLFINLGLLTVFVALAWFAYRIEERPPAAPTVALTTLSTDRIENIQIERNGVTVARLQRNGEVWHLLTPIDATADGFRVRALLGLARARSSVGFRAAGNDLSQYGLQPARATVRFDTTALLIGETDPVAGHRYVMSDDQVHLIEDNWFSQIFGSGTAWLDPRPLPAGAELLSIELPDGSHQDSRSSARWQLIDGHWQRTGSRSEASTDAQKISQRGAALADAWRQARALSVQRVDSALAWDGQVSITFASAHHPATTATAKQRAASQSGNPETIVFSVARTKDALFLARKDLDVQYRFLTRQGHSLLDTKATR